MTGAGHRLAALALLVLGCAAAWAAATYPALSGRVVDGAGLLSADTKASLEHKLDELEAKSSIQLVVATVPDLGGEEIEPFANGLFRAWKLGEAKRNNGVLLLIAPKERRVRIEVGYGLEGVLTDAISKVIITNAIVPRFKAGDFPGGVVRGTDDIITVLTTDTSDWQKRPEFRAQPDDPDVDLLPIAFFVIVGLIVVLYISRRVGRRGGFGGGNVVVLPPLGGGSSWGSGSSWSGGGGFDSGGGFSGGGGSSGGGGASGGW